MTDSMGASVSRIGELHHADFGCAAQAHRNRVAADLIRLVRKTDGQGLPVLRIEAVLDVLSQAARASRLGVDSLETIRLEELAPYQQSCLAQSDCMGCDLEEQIR